MATKEDLKKLEEKMATKEELKRLEERVNSIEEDGYQGGFKETGGKDGN